MEDGCYEFTYKSDYFGILSEHAGECHEVVFHHDNKIHDAWFSARNLGTASRSEYLRVMTASVADRYGRGQC